MPRWLFSLRVGLISWRAIAPEMLTPVPLLLVVATHPIQYQVPWFRALAASGSLRVRVCYLRTPDESAEDPGFQRRFAWDVPLLSGYEWCRVGEDSGFWSVFRASRPDVVMVLGWNERGLLRAWCAARLQRIPLIVRGDSNARRARPGWVRFLHRLLLSLPARFLVVGRSNADFYSRSGVPDSAMVHAPHFVDNAFFAERSAASSRLDPRLRWGVGAHFCILFAGKFEVKKRPGDLLKAIQRLPDALRARIRVLMVGAGRLDAELRAEAAPLGELVIWAGFLNQTEIPVAYAAADLLVLPSDHGETWGLVVNEAMACGVPAIVSDQVGCANDLVRHGETGLVFPMGDVDALAGCIASLASDPERCRQMGDAARALVNREYTIERSVDATVAVAQELSGCAGARNVAAGTASTSRSRR